MLLLYGENVCPDHLYLMLNLFSRFEYLIDWFLLISLPQSRDTMQEYVASKGMFHLLPMIQICD